jgi:hypothetical protein
MKKFLSGWLVATAVNSLEQDLLGKESYMKLIDAAWVSWTVTVPMAIATLICAVWLYTSKKPID